MKFTGERFIPEAALLKDEIGFEQLHRYYAAISLVRGKTVLDIDCANGHGTAILAPYGKHVTGAGTDAVRIDAAKKTYGSNPSQLVFATASLTALPFPPGSFDVVISFDTIDELPKDEQYRFILEIKRVLRDDGFVLLSSKTKEKITEDENLRGGLQSFDFDFGDFIFTIKEHFTSTHFFTQGYEPVSIISNGKEVKAPSPTLHQFNVSDFIAERFTLVLASNAALPSAAAQLVSVALPANNTYMALSNHDGKTNGAATPFDGAKMESAEPALDAEKGQETTTMKLKEPTREPDNVVQDLRKQVRQLETARQQLQEQLTAIQAANIKLNAQVQERDLLTAELTGKLHQLYHDSDKVKERLSEIYSSDGWRLLSRYYRLKGKLIPEDSNRYKQLRKLAQMVKGKPKMLPAPVAAPPVETLLNVIIEPLTIPFFEFPAVSIIIPAYNGWRMNYQCIAAIIMNTFGVAYEIILADDFSTDETSNCTSIIENIVHVRSKENLGFLRNCNYAATFAKGKYVLFLNNDTTVCSNWLAPMFNLAEQDELVGMVGAKLLYPDGRLQEAGGIIWNDASGWNYGHGKDPKLPEFNYVKEADYLSGACIMVRSTLWRETGGFDQRYSPAYFEDADLAFTIRSMGYKVLYQPLSAVIHYEGYSHGTEKNISAITPDTPRVKSYQALNNRKFFNKWQHVLLKEHFAHGQNLFRARDRSKHRKTMLVVDHYVPHFDKDAGSKTTFQYLELFTSMDLNVKFLGDNFFQHEPYTTSLQQLGVEVLYGSWYHDHWQEWVTDNGKDIDYIYLNRPHISIKYIDFFIKTTRATILYYGHDLHFLREQKQYAVEQNPKLLKSAEKWKETECYLFENADIVLTPSDEENKIISALSPRYRVETILPYFFGAPAIPLFDFNHRVDFLFVGGFTHQPNVDAVTWFCEAVWPKVKAALPAAKFLVVGSNPPAAITALQNEDIIVHGFVSEPELHSIYQRAKVVVIPLRYGAGVKGKTVEALYQGLPVVTTSFGVEGMPGDTSFIQPRNEAASFADESIRLYTNNQLLQLLSKEGANYINTYFTRTAAAKTMNYLLGRSSKK